MRFGRWGLLAAAMSSALLFRAAGAADLPVGTPTPATVVAATFSWTGGYVGGFVGGAWGDRDVSSTEPCAVGVPEPACFYNGAAGGVPNTYSLGSAFGGGTIGYNWQVPGTPWVWGIEGEGGYLGLRRTVLDVNAPAGANDSFDTTRLGGGYGVVAGRLGYTFDRLLVYAKGGVAFVQKHYDFTCTVAPCGTSPLTISRDKIDITWTAGGGLEYAFSSNWSIKGEYLYLATDESFTLTGTRSDGAFTYTVVHTDPAVHTVKVGLNFRLANWQ